MSRSITARWSLFTLAALGCTSAFAQIKTDGEWRGTGGLAFSSTSGNSTSTALALNADMARATVQDKMTLGASSNYARSKANGTTSTTSNKWASWGQYDYNLSSNVFAFGKLGAEGDTLTELTLRTTLAGGLGVKLFDTQAMSMNVFGGAAYTTDRYDTAQTIGSRTGKTFNRSSMLLGEESPPAGQQHQLQAAPGGLPGPDRRQGHARQVQRRVDGGRQQQPECHPGPDRHLQQQAAGGDQEERPRPVHGRQRQVRRVLMRAGALWPHGRVQSAADYSVFTPLLEPAHECLFADRPVAQDGARRGL